MHHKKRTDRGIQGFKICLFAVGTMLASMLTGLPGQAATVDFNARITELQNKFPDGAYWNHVGWIYIKCLYASQDIRCESCIWYEWLYL